ncbi:unnamed protein product [Kuraishia capsulata CBS 1993]|uniref:Amino-acid acetyltransferase, mitochondrial n=1 Tax=Kuraishia capsulata CBS 1993 TaxID=1382522 RepID=W6MM95_9ASCO|nr:uncharacterized protein KUCA_T00003635001 [Kuraishia capsulata CBS 1993]CDK27656.1 unnamed protein product [Kuraishia capsulata CBS 1993]
MLLKANPGVPVLFRRFISTPKALRDFKSNLEIHKQLTKEKRDLILTILKSAASKREVRSYIQKYPLLKQNDIYDNSNLVRLENSQVEPGFRPETNTKYDEILKSVVDYTPAKGEEAFRVSPSSKNEISLSGTLRLGIIRIRDLKRLSLDTITGIGSTVHKLVQLGLSPLIVVDVDSEMDSHGENGGANFIKLVTTAIVEQSDLLIDKFENFSTEIEPLSLRSVRGLFEIEDGNMRFTLPELLLVPLAQGIIPVVAPVAVNLGDETQSFMRSSDAIKTIASELKRFNQEYVDSHGGNLELNSLLTVEKIIYIDNAGGIPSLERFKSSHVYINLLQEYDDIVAELYVGFLKPDFRDRHLQNLQDVNEVLSVVPEATGIITTPEIAMLRLDADTANPLIYNVLTDRPTISSSLPVNLRRTPMLNTTVVKKGMPLTVFTSEAGEAPIDLVKYDKAGLIDLPRLKNLIDDSFGRDLDLDHYLRRVNGKVAAVIVAGDYEGGAIITLEKSSYSDTLVPYLDKFAVLRSKQGTPGVADVVFKAMLSLFEDELLWRSRTNNPVNRYYFDRSKGNFTVDGNLWRGFYSGKKVRTRQDFRVYNDICGSIEPSWKK